MTDLHTHILPGIDDGSPNTGCSLEMLRLEMKQGAGTVCLTPHYYADEPVGDFIKKRDRAFEGLLSAAAARKAELPELVLGAEVAYFPGISRSEELEMLCLGDTGTLLLEMPYAGWQDFEIDEVISVLLDRKLQVVLAHPERLLGFDSNEKKLQRLLRFPVGLQINAASLQPGSLFSRQRARSRIALSLLKQTELPFLGSDCHNLSGRKPNLLQGIQVLQAKGETELLERIGDRGRFSVSFYHSFHET